MLVKVGIGLVNECQDSRRNKFYTTYGYRGECLWEQLSHEGTVVGKKSECNSLSEDAF